MGGECERKEQKIKIQKTKLKDLQKTIISKNEYK